jgi:uncharacterized protein (TIGR02246 family)
VAKEVFMKLSRPWVLLIAVLFLEFPSVRSQASAAGARVEQKPSAQEAPSADEIAIRTEAAEWDKATGAKDLEKVISFYADDASLLPQGAPIATGKDAIRRFWASLMARPGFAASFGSTKVEVATARDLAYEEGTYLVTTNDSDGKPHVQKGKYVVVWKKPADGKWKAVADIFNTDE